MKFLSTSFLIVSFLIGENVRTSSNWYTVLWFNWKRYANSMKYYAEKIMENP